MKRTIFFTAALAAAFAVAGCTETAPGPGEGGPTPLGSIGLAEVSGAKTRVDNADPTLSTIAQRAQAGAELTVRIADASAPYVYSDGSWVPSGTAVEFLGYGTSEIELTLGDPSAVQDGSAEGLLDADVLTYKAQVSPTRELRGIQLTHAKTLIEVEIDGELTLDEGTGITVNDAVGYNTPGTNDYVAIIESGAEGFNITLSSDGTEYTIWTDKSQVTGGEFKPNYRYRLVLTNVGNAVELKAITLEPWGESGEGTARALVGGSINLGANYPTGTPVTVTYEGGAVNTLEFDNPSKPSVGNTWGIEGDVIKNIRIGENPEILIGRAVGGDIVLDVNADLSTVTLREDASSRYLVGSIAELRMIDGAGMATGSFLQEGDLHLSKMPWTPLFYFDDVNSNHFKGIYDGGGFKIYDLLYANGGGALFKGNDGGTIRNVHLASGMIGGRGFINNAGICVFNLSGTIENCTNEAIVEGGSWVAGICAINQGTIKNCVNRGEIRGYGDGGFSNAGGIVAMNGDAGQANWDDALIENCTNYGLVYGLAYTNGGIAASNMMGTITGSTNNGEVRGVIYNAGIAATNWNVITDCTNNGSITSTNGFTGGIVAISYADTDFGTIYPLIAGCVNNGTVTSQTIGASGGIISMVHAIGTVVEDCTNNGSIQGSASVGGIAGDNQEGSVRACINTGIVKASDTIAGGIAGESSSVIIACYNTSTSVSARDRSGGIVGWNYEAGLVSGCYSTGAVTVGPGRSGFGGIVAENVATATVIDCYWSGTTKGIAIDNNQTATVIWAFSAENWPSADASKNWGIGSDYEGGNFWASLGSWDVQNPVYPELYRRINEN